MKKIVNIAATSGGEDNETDVIYALCDDGSIWILVGSSERQVDNDWRRLPDIPEDDS